MREAVAYATVFSIGGILMKRSNGEGTIFKRKDGRWCAAYFDDSLFPKRHYVYGKTQKEVKKKLKELKGNPLPDSFKDGKEYTLQSWMQYYLENYKRNEIKASTYTTYMETYQKHIMTDPIGKIKLNKITSNHLQSFYNKKTEQGYSPRTVKHMHVLINSSLEKAVRLKYIRENINKLVTLPKKKPYEAKVLTALEVSKILREATDEELYPLIVFTLFTGLRKGEVLALKWTDINFQTKELTVSGNLCRISAGLDEKGRHCRKYEIMSPKTVKSKRTIPLFDKAIDVLKLQKERQEIIKEKYGLIYQDQGFIFAKHDGQHLSPRCVMDEYHAFLQKYGVTDVRFHDLRHTFASLLLEAGESPKVIQELLGHSTITTTMDIYAHVTKQGKVNAVSKLELLMNEV